MRLTRRQFTAGTVSGAGLLALGPMGQLAQAARNDELNILCWEGYNSSDVLEPFRTNHPDARIRAESGTSDPDMINKLRAGEIRVWDLINVNQPWARDQLYPEDLIRPLDRNRFLPYFEAMLPEFSDPPYPLAFADNGDLLGMPQRYGPFSFVVNTDRISRETAENEGWNLFLDPAMKGRYGVLTYQNWNIIHMCLTAGIDPFSPLSSADMDRFEEVAGEIFGNAKFLGGDLVQMNLALINGEIDAYFTGGTYTASPARLDGATNIRAITPQSGPVDGKGGVVWVELTSVVNNPDPSNLGPEFLEFVQRPDICHEVAFSEGTYNPIAQMGNEAVMSKFSTRELDAIQFDSLDEEMSRSLDYQVVPSYNELNKAYSAAKRS
mgnify:FL=1